VAADEPAHALHERLLAARGDEQHPQPPDGLGGQAARDGQKQGDRRKVVVGARDDGPAGHVGHRRHRAEREGHPRQAQDADPGQRAGRDERGAGGHERPRPQGGVVARVGSRGDPGGDGRDARVEDEAGAGGVVVGDEHEGAPRGRVAGPGDDVRRGPAGQEAAHELGAGRDVVDDERCGRGRGEACGAAARGRADPAGCRARGEPEPGGQAERDVEGARGLLGLQRDVGDPAGSQLPGDALGRGPLARGRRGTADGRELLDEGSQIQGLGAGGAHPADPR